MIYSQGDIIRVSFDPTLGHEPQKTRPALVVSNDFFNRSNSMTIVCPISSRLKPFFLHQPLPADCPVQGSVIMEQVRAIDLDARPTELLGHLSEPYLSEILLCISTFFEK